MNPKIKIIDDQKPEDIAMMQALYSRSPASVDSHLEKVKEKGSGSFMDKFYVGYGHSSIGDCGTAVVFIEGVTMLTAKAIQDWPLYSGQESSTRYMDFSEAEFFNPLGSKEGEEIQERWREFYLKAQDPVREHIRNRYPRQGGENENTYERAVGARSFDTLRCFLPAGATTNLSWSTNLRQAQDHLNWMFYHPDEFISSVAKGIFEDLKSKYPNSFREPKQELASYRSKVMQEHYYIGPNDIDDGVQVRTDLMTHRSLISSETELLQKRPRGAEIPWFFSEHGLIESTFPLDFGSYRDLQRHRNGTIRMPLLSTVLGFNKWYLEELPPEYRDLALDLLGRQEEAISNLRCSPVVAQNYIAMGYNVPCKVTQGLPAFVYRLELRSGKTVHPSLRRVVLEEIRQFRGHFPNILLHVDEDPDSWTIRRGKQTIEEK